MLLIKNNGVSRDPIVHVCFSDTAAVRIDRYNSSKRENRLESVSLVSDEVEVEAEMPSRRIGGRRSHCGTAS